MPRKPKIKHNCTLRVRNEIADALDRIQFEDGTSKSAVIAEGVEMWLRRREKRIRLGKRSRQIVPPVGECPASRLVEEIQADPMAVRGVVG